MASIVFNNAADLVPESQNWEFTRVEMLHRKKPKGEKHKAPTLSFPRENKSAHAPECTP